MGDDRIDSFDDLFEPFELEDGPPPASSSPAPEPTPPAAPIEPEPAPEPVATVPCPSCGTHNPAYNRHCEACLGRRVRLRDCARDLADASDHSNRL